jgi:hypothetical protein
MSTLYRTNTFTGREEWYSTPWYVLGHLDNENMWRGINCAVSLLAAVNREAFADRILNMQNNEERLQEFMARTPEEKTNFFESVFDEYNRFIDNPIKIAVWFSHKDIVLSRTRGYGKNLCKENGGVYRCYDQGKMLLSNGFDCLNGYNDVPKLQGDPLINNKLISRAELEELLAYEESSGRVLAPTCLKKDVLNVLKAARNGLIGDVSPDYKAVEEAQERIRDRILDDLL